MDISNNHKFLESVSMPLLTEANLNNTIMGSNPMGSTPMGSNSMGSNPMGSNPMGSNPMGSNPMGSNPMGSNPMGSILRRTSKKERDSAKRCAFYNGFPPDEIRPRFEIWGNRMIESYLTNFNTNYLSLFYDTDSKFSFINMNVTEGTSPGIYNMIGAEAIYNYLQVFRQLKFIHLKSQVVLPKSDYNSIMVTMNLDIEPTQGNICHVVTTIILEKLPGKKPRRVIGEGTTKYEACQYIANQSFMIMP